MTSEQRKNIASAVAKLVAGGGAKNFGELKKATEGVSASDVGSPLQGIVDSARSAASTALTAAATAKSLYDSLSRAGRWPAA